MGRQSRRKAARQQPARRADVRDPQRGDGGRNDAERWRDVFCDVESEAVTPWRELWRAHWTPAVVLFALALVARLVVLLQITGTPYAEVTNIDSDSYLTWATEMATRSWLGTGGYYQSPLYAWYLAAFQKVLGPSTWPPRVGQIVLGSASPVLLYAIGTRLFSRRVGWLAGLALCLYGPLILEEVTLSKTSLLVVSVLAAFALFLRYAPVARVRGVAAAGFLFGVTVVGVAQWLLGFLALGVMAFVMPRAADRRRRSLSAGAFLVAGIVAIAPVAAWNTWHFGGLVLTSGGAGLNFYSGNNERATALPSSPPGLRDVPRYEEEDSRTLAEREVGHPMNEAQVSRYWSGQARAFILGHPGAYLALLGLKLVAMWNAYEIPDNYHYAFMRAYFVPVLYGALTFGIVAPLALVGAFRPFWRRRQLTALYVVTLATLAPLLVFYVRSRYRLPAVPFLMVLAAVAVERLYGAVRARDRRATGWSAGAILVAALFVNHTYCEPAHHGFPALCLGGDTWFDSEWLKLSAWYEARGDFDRSLAYARRAGECTSPRRPGAAQFAIGTAAARSAVALDRRGERDAALERVGVAESAFAASIHDRYRVGDAHNNRIMALAMIGLDERARAATREALRRREIDRARVTQIATKLTQQGRSEDAAALTAVLADAPGG